MRREICEVVMARFPVDRIGGLRQHTASTAGHAPPDRNTRANGHAGSDAAAHSDAYFDAHADCASVVHVRRFAFAPIAYT